jgi:cytochrome c oxidase subunit 4
MTDHTSPHPINAPGASSAIDAPVEEGYSHVASIRVLVSVFASLIVLTAITVAVTQFDLGPTWNLIVALTVATVKAGLVVAFFMHLLWDRRFNLLLFLSSILFVILFLSFSVGDRSEYQKDIDSYIEWKETAAHPK